MRNKIALLSSDPGWRLYLNQEGLSFEVLPSVDNLSPSEYSVVIVNGQLTQTSFSSLRDFVTKGGAVLDCGPYADHAGISRERRTVKWICPALDDDRFSSSWLCDVSVPLNVSKAFAHFGGAVGFQEEGNGVLGFLPADVGSFFTNTSSKRKSFYTPFGKFPTETVAYQSKGEWRKIVTDALKWLHRARGLPFAQLSHFPGSAPNVFLYRLDSDFGEQRQIDTLYQLAARYDVQISWFLHVGAHEPWLKKFKMMSKQEIAVHCYDHSVLGSYEDSRRQIEKALFFMKDAGLVPSGFASPYGIWSKTIARVTEDLGFIYASEFTLDYDNFPFYPWLGGRFSSVLQIPIHPVCIGNLIRAKASSEEMKSYYRFIVEKKLFHREPITLYHHPTHECWDVVEDTFAYVSEKKLPSLTFLEYARWWKSRSEILFDIYTPGDELRLVSNHPSVVRVHVTNPRGESALLELNKTYDRQEIPWVKCGSPARVPSDIDRIRRFSLREWQHTIEDLKNRF